MRNFKKKAVAVISVSAMSAGAMAADMDMSAVTGAVKEAGTAVATVGAAVLLVYVGIKVWKWVRGAL
ncbi:major capsid protein [Chitinimonas lacunae]|uniref:Major capsid protein n=1 Tax=Chitinimonas lacunae TaxID=1963018 RepID=A0ABV8MMA0_9NEIS